jgi:hypothetical protein
MSYISTESTIVEYREFDSDTRIEFPTFREYCLYLCGGDFTAFDDYETLSKEMKKEDLNGYK